MKNILSILGISSMVLSSCSSYTINTFGTKDDDLYFSKKDAQFSGPIYNEEVRVNDLSPANSSSYSNQDQQNTSANYSNYTPSNNNDYSNQSNQNYNNGSQERSIDENGQTVVNNYYGDVYEDNGGYFSTRIQRFHRPMLGFGYYSPAYCGFYNDPFWNPGWNIGFGWSNGFGPSWGVGYGWGFGGGFYDPFFNPWFDPWFSPYYGFGGWGFNNPYAWGYRNGYWDGRNDAGFWNGGNAWGGNRNTVIRGPRPGRGGIVSTAGGRTVPTREVGSGTTSSGTENIRALPPSRNLPNNVAPANNNAAESRPVPNTSPNGYVPPRLPNNTAAPIRSEDAAPTRTSSPVRISQPSRESTPVRVNPNFGGPSNNGNENTRSISPTPRRVESSGGGSRRNESSSPRMSAPSRSSAPSSAPSRGSFGGGGGGSAPASRPRPR